MIIYENILKEFQKQKVKYVLVGGMAVNLLGALRATNDLDVLVELSDKNLLKIVKILKKNGYHIKQPVDPAGIADKKIRGDWIKNKNLKALNFYKEGGMQEVDLIIDSPVLFKKAYSDCVTVKAAGMVIKVASIDDMIKMKRKAGRAIDKFDIAELKTIRKLKKKNV